MQHAMTSAFEQQCYTSLAGVGLVLTLALYVSWGLKRVRKHTTSRRKVRSIMKGVYGFLSVIFFPTIASGALDAYWEWTVFWHHCLFGSFVGITSGGLVGYLFLRSYYAHAFSAAKDEYRRARQELIEAQGRVTKRDVREFLRDMDEAEEQRKKKLSESKKKSAA